MPPISRRTALAGGAAVTAAAVTGVVLATRDGNTQRDAQAFAPGVEPEVLRSIDGVLSVEMEAAYTQTTISGIAARVMTYGGTLPGATWRVKPGDRIDVKFTNRLGEVTNLHAHGLHVSPSGNSDNIFVSLEDGESFEYSYQLDPTHTPGICWYHPHPHGTSARQLSSGLYGAIIVEEVDPPAVDADRVLILSDIAIADSGDVAEPTMHNKMMGREGTILLTNGQAQPVYPSKQHGVERWRILNTCSSRYLQIRIDGASAQLLGIDTGHYEQGREFTTVLLPPAQRADLLVQLGESAAELIVDTYDFRLGGGMTNPGPVFTDFVAARFEPGEAASGLEPITPTFAPEVDLRGEAVAARRSFELMMPGQMGGGMGGGGSMGGNHEGGMGNMGTMSINGKPFDAERVNTTVSMGSVEEWTLVNNSGMHHPFHIHVWPMQVLRIGDQEVEGVEYQDVVDVPARSTSVVRLHFNEFPGKTMYHCHILDHEDMGMMGVVELTEG